MRIPVTIVGAAAGKITKSKQPLPMYTLARLNTQGQAISASKELLDEKLTIDNKEGLAKASKGLGRKIKAAVTFPGGTHDLWMRYWMSANGIDPNKDADLAADRERIRGCLEKINHQGVTGPIRFNADGDAVLVPTVLQAKGGKWAYLR